MSLSTLIFLANFSAALKILMLFTAVGLLAALCCGILSKAWDGNKLWDTFSKVILLLIAVFALLTCLIPDKDTAYLMIAANGMNDAVSTPEQVKARQFLNRGLDNILSYKSN